MTVKDSGFWWIEDDVAEREETYQPLYKYIDAPEPVRRHQKNSNDSGTTDTTVDHTVFQF